MADVSNTAPPTSDNANSVEVVSGKIMVASIIVLFMVIVFILFLHLYARWFWSQNYTAGDQEQGTGPTRRFRRRRFVFAPTQDALGSVYQEGLEPEVIRSLPVVIFNGDEFKDGLECAVCLCEVEDGEKARLLPKCNHGFHVECIDMWFQSHSTCPICRNTVSGSATKPGQEDVESTDDSSSFPTNVLFWGNGQNPVSSRTISQEGPSSSSTPNGMLVIEIPNTDLDAFPSLPSSNEMKSPTTSSTPRFRSLTRLMSRGKRVIPSGPPSPAPAPAPSSTNFDVEQGQVGRGQISKTNSDS